MSDEIQIRSDLRAGDLGRVIELHGTCYDDLPGFGLSFEAYVARTIAEYVLDNQARGRLWLAEQGSRLIGCTAIALRDNGVGQLRWVLVDQSARGMGLASSLSMPPSNTAVKPAVSPFSSRPRTGYPSHKRSTRSSASTSYPMRPKSSGTALAHCYACN